MTNIKNTMSKITSGNMALSTNKGAQHTITVAINAEILQDVSRSGPKGNFLTFLEYN